MIARDQLAAELQQFASMLDTSVEIMIGTQDEPVQFCPMKGHKTMVACTYKLETTNVIEEMKHHILGDLQHIQSTAPWITRYGIFLMTIIPTPSMIRFSKVAS